MGLNINISKVYDLWKTENESRGVSDFVCNMYIYLQMENVVRQCCPYVYGSYILMPMRKFVAYIFWLRGNYACCLYLCVFCISAKKLFFFICFIISLTLKMHCIRQVKQNVPGNNMCNLLLVSSLFITEKGKNYFQIYIYWKQA